MALNLSINYSPTDTYCPAEGCATCPHCGSQLDGAPPITPWLHFAFLRWECPVCHGSWNETREGTITERFY